ncbi:MAG: branched-chain amino acid ABC transporter substrate-binding protein [Nitrospirae bacterium]|nr:branched-chain amino acid ABC transporter substrate-binding protein [Nitrospirota bacterium]
MEKRFTAFGKLILVLALSLFTINSCSKKEAAVRIGVVGPMTGDQSKMGLDVKHGVELAVKEWNDRGGVLGKKIELLAEDDQHDPKQAVLVANKLVNAGVAGVIGHFNSSASIPASAVYNKSKVPMITPASTNPRLTEQGFEYVFRVCGRDDQQGLIAAIFVSDVLKLKKVAVIHDKTTYGQGLADEFKKALGNKVEVVYYTGIIQGDKDFRSVLTTMRDKKPQLLYFGGIYPEGGLLIKQARELGINVPFMSGDGSIDQKLIDIAGTSSEGSYLTFSPDPANIKSAKNFLSSYSAAYGETGPYSIYAYDAANILLQAIAGTRGIDGEKISRAIHNMKHSGALGELQWDVKGDVLRAPYIVWVIKNGKFAEHWKPSENAR